MVRLRSHSLTFTSSNLPLRRRKPRMCVQASSPSIPSQPHKWHLAKATDRCFRLSQTLPIGQAFRWSDCGTHPHPPAFQGLAREWAGAIGNSLVVLRQAEEVPPAHNDDPVWYRFVVGGGKDAVEDYFRLRHDVTHVMKEFCERDETFARLFTHFRGARVIRQEPGECLFSFICSANNNIKRISAMVRWLAKRYGRPLGVHDGAEYFEFPHVRVLAREADEEELRAAGFGYRAKYIVGTAKMLQTMAEGEGVSAEDLLLSWRKLKMKEVSEKLVKFPGVGRKVASCVGLFSLDQLGEIPCDTHIWQIATRYLPQLRQKSLTERVYDQVGDFFREKFSEDHAGLAQTIMFAGELPEFQKTLPGYAKPAKKKRKAEDKLELERSADDVVKTEVVIEKTSNIEKEETLVRVSQKRRKKRAKTHENPA